MRAAGAAHQPAPPLTRLIGRKQDVAAVRNALMRGETRLLTLVGPPGIGKTRLGLAVARDVHAAFGDGTYFVALAPIGNAALVLATIAQTLGIKEIAGQPLLDQLKTALRTQRLLLVLDNFEHLLDAAPLVVDLLEACPGLKAVITSRAALHVRGERLYGVPPLLLPDLTQFPATAVLARTPAVALFVECAQGVMPDFRLTAQNAAAVAEICVRLDGLPLEIELAATRIKLLPAEALLARLEQRLGLLSGGLRDVPTRQQTLRSTIDWSYNLLQTGKRMLFRSLAVFVGGFSFEAAEAICAADSGLPFSVLDGLLSLADNSLLHQEQGSGGEPRFVMLETIREYALEKLVEQSEIAALQRRHAAYHLALAERADSELRGAHMLAWLARLNQENDNLRTALTWYQSQADGTEANVRLAGALWLFWFVQGLWAEGRTWLEGALARFQKSELEVSAQYAWAAGGAGMLAWLQGDWSEATALGEKALAYGQRAGNRRIVADALYLLSQCAISRGELVQALDLANQSLGLQRVGGD